jgi:hypothetical protein
LLTESKPDQYPETQERVRFETLLADICTRFVNASPGHEDREIEDAQRAICECLEVDHSSLWQVSWMALTNCFSENEKRRAVTAEKRTGQDDQPEI